MKKYITYGGIAVLLLVGCAAPTKMIGANYLQNHQVAMNSIQSRISLLHLKDIGANTVAFVPFLQQDAPDSIDVHLTDKVTDDQLRAGIRDAKALGFRVVLKPQIIVTGSWAGMIKMTDDYSWLQWFNNYAIAIEHYINIASEEKVDIFVIGTELNQTAHLTSWQPLIARIRQHFGGKLTYAAHNVDGVRQFNHWQLLDIISLTLYPSLGEVPERDAMSSHIRRVVGELRAISRKYKKPLWIIELGIPSRHGAQLHPWEWHESDIHSYTHDEALQALVLDLWLDALRGKWNHGVMLWCWSSNPNGGGSKDNGFILQNKRAEQVVACRWTGHCEPP